MQGNTIGTLFRVTTFGESHGEALGVVIDGAPAGFELDVEALQLELDRRRPGQSTSVSPRKETDRLQIISGIFKGKTTGTPLTAVLENQDARSKDYSELKNVFRPGHADFTYLAKYGHRDYRGGGRASARETASRVIAGAVAKQYLAKAGIIIRGGLAQVGSVKARQRLWDEACNNELNALDPDAVSAMLSEIQGVQKQKDSVGGLLELQAEGVPPGLGEPVFAKLDAAIAAAMMSIPAAKSVEIGAGVAAASMKGSEMCDEMLPEGFLSNNHGGILGGISSGAPVLVRVAFKPTSSIGIEQKTVNSDLEPAVVSTKGRHDACVAIRAVPVAEAMLAVVMMDFLLQDLAARGVRGYYEEALKLSYGMAELSEK